MNHTRILPKKVSSQDFERAIDAWKQKIGKNYVLLGDDDIEKYGQSTIPTKRKLAAILLPGSVEEVQDLVNIARAYKIPLYTISRGKNWGYGSACPVQNNNVIVDLKRMNRILEVNTELAYTVVEPGVTQGQLYQYLQSNRIPLWMDSTAAPSDSSLIGNTLERGFGHSPYGDHFLSACGMEVVLADGRILRTGFGHYDNAKAWKVFKWGLGPYLDGLFTQSNYGIVTKIGIWLMPKPHDFIAFFFQTDLEKNLKPLINALRPLRLGGIIESSLHIGNDVRVLSHMQQYPWEAAGYKTALPESVKKDLKKRWNLQTWHCSGALYGTRPQNAESKRLIKKALKGIAKVHFITDRRLRIICKLKDILKMATQIDMTPMVSMLNAVYGLMKGIPTGMFIAGSYWRMKKPVLETDMDPDRDKCGLIWLSPVIPMTGDAAMDILKIAKPVFDKHGFEMIISMTMITQRAIDCVIAISYDKSDPVDTEKAYNCYKELLRANTEAGYIPYRLGIQSMEYMTQKEDVFWDVVQDIKKAIDPVGILSPGRYCR